MKVGLIGLPSSGKSTLFQLLTGHPPAVGGHREKPAIGIAKVPDPRVDTLFNLHNSKRATYPTFTVAKIPSLIPAGTGDSGESVAKGLDPKGFVDALRDTDALMLVIRAFDDPMVPHIRGSIDPARDLRDLSSELLLVDWQLVQTRIERLESARKKAPNHHVEVAVLQKALQALEAEIPLHKLEVNDDERAALATYTFFTDKPAIVGVNVSDSDLSEKEYPGRDDVMSIAETMGAPVVEFSALVEVEIADLDPEDRQAFMDDLQIEASGVERLARIAYERLGLISYFTVGETEVRAWTIRRGTNAKDAAGAIHSDISRGFIRAEVAHYSELVEEGGWKAMKEKGRLRLEGKEYEVKDGDVMIFRFNV